MITYFFNVKPKNFVFEYVELLTTIGQSMKKTNLECTYFENVRTVNLLVSLFMDAYLLLKTTNPQEEAITIVNDILPRMIALCRYALLARTKESGGLRPISRGFKSGQYEVTSETLASKNRRRLDTFVDLPS